VKQKPSFAERLSFKLFAFIVNRPAVYAFAKTIGRLAGKLQPLVRGSALDPARGWTKTRDLPPVASQTFKEFWRTRSKS
jgi:L-lactate dehydrogenase complex protein LldF